MDITWLGHSCFRIKGKETALVTDPYPPSLGYEIGHPQASIITVSHSHPNHSYIQAVDPPEGGPDPKVLSKPGEYEIGGIFITGLPSFHDADEGKKLGKNNIYLLEFEGLALCHLGDLGHPLSASQAKALGKIDVLFVPVGGGSTIDAAVATAIAQQLKARVVIPMHHATEFTPKLGPVSAFLKQFGATDEAATASRPRLSVTTASLPEKAQVAILDYPRKKAAAGQ